MPLAQFFWVGDRPHSSTLPVRAASYLGPPPWGARGVRGTDNQNRSVAAPLPLLGLSSTGASSSRMRSASLSEFVPHSRFPCPRVILGFGTAPKLIFSASAWIS